MILTFGPFELVLTACELRREGMRVPMQPRVFDTLRYLVVHRDRIVSKRELIDVFWAGQSVDSTVLPWSIGHARKALGQTRTEPGYIRTVRGRGYRFIGAVQTSARAAGEVVKLHEPLDKDHTSDPFVGRDEVMLQLAAALEAAHTGRGRLVLMSGEPGIGKTRCASEFRSVSRNLGYVTWAGRCVERVASPAFWPFIQVLREACGDPSLPAAERCEAQELLQQLVPARTAAPDSESPESGVACFWLLDRLTRFLVRTGTSRTRILTFDDLHLADENSLRALALLAPLLEHSRLLVIAATRDSTAEAKRTAVALALLLKPCARIELGGLTLGDVAQYLGAMLGEAPADELSRAVHARTTGNPLFVHEAVRIVSEKHTHSRALRAEDVTLPEAIKGFLMDRLAAVEPAARVVLDAASVMGEAFESLLLQRVTGLEGDSLFPLLQSAEAARIVESRRDALEHGFVHPLMREVLYDGLSDDQRADWHARVGLALETVAVVDLRLHQLAHHFHLARPSEHSERAARYCRLAGDAAMRVFAYDDAAQYYAWALQAQTYPPRSDARLTCELLLSSAAALQRADRRVEWRQSCKLAIELARQSGLAEVLVQAARQLRPSAMSALVPDGLVVAALEEALVRLPDHATEARALAYGRLASIPPYALDIERSRTMSDEAMRLAQVSGDRSLLVEALRSRFRSLSGPDSMPELLRVADELLRADPQAQSWWSADALIVRYHTLLRLGDATAAERALAMFGRMAAKLNERVWGWHHDRMLAHRALREGRLEEAELQFAELFEESQRLSLPYGPMLYAGQLNALNLERTGRQLISGADVEATDPWKWAQDLPMHRVDHISREIQLGEIERGRGSFHTLSADHFAAVTRDSNYLFVMTRLSTAATALDERACAQELYEALKPYSELFAVSDLSVSVGSVSYFLGMLAWFLGLRAEARQHLARAIERNRETGHNLRAIRSQLALAELLAESCSLGERAEALALAREVAASAQGYGTTGLHQSATVLVEREM